VTDYGWDYTAFPLGRLSYMQDYNLWEGTIRTATTFTYFANGLVKEINTPSPGEAGLGNTVTTSFTYDFLGNPLTVTRPANNSGTSLTTTFNYTSDGAYNQPAAIGQPLTVTNPAGEVTHFRYDSRGTTRSVTDARNYQTDISYNLADQAETVTYPSTRVPPAGRASTRYAYLYPGGPPTTVTEFDESNVQVRQTTATYGPEGELRTRSGSAETVSVSFDAAHRLKELTDGKNQKTSYLYHPAGYLSEILYPGGERVRFPFYNENGQPTQRIDGRGVTTNYVYQGA
jgi:YD repeat-containing protein